jgi:hypothetical protein
MINNIVTYSTFYNVTIVTMTTFNHAITVLVLVTMVLLLNIVLATNIKV